MAFERYGLEWTGPRDFLAKPMDDGYWTPWHLADARVKALEADRDQISLTLDVAKADRDKWFNRARDLEAALKKIITACTSMDDAWARDIAKAALTASETGGRAKMSRTFAHDLLKAGGPWLGTAREFVQRKASNGETVIWGSGDRVSLSMREIEEMASEIAASVLNSYSTSDRA